MEIYLSHFDSSLFVPKGNTLVNERNDIVITVFPEEEMFALYISDEFVKVEADSGFEELVNQIIVNEYVCGAYTSI